MLNDGIIHSPWGYGTSMTLRMSRCNEVRIWEGDREGTASLHRREPTSNPLKCGDSVLTGHAIEYVGGGQHNGRFGAHRSVHNKTRDNFTLGVVALAWRTSDEGA